MMPENHAYLSIDLKSFYASVECVERGLNPLTTNLVVADAARTGVWVSTAADGADHNTVTDEAGNQLVRYYYRPYDKVPDGGTDPVPTGPETSDVVDDGSGHQVTVLPSNVGAVKLTMVSKQYSDENSSDAEIDRMREAAAKKNWPEEVGELFEKELAKVERLNPAVAEYSVQMTYLQLMLELPWNDVTKDNLDLRQAHEQLAQPLVGQSIRIDVERHLSHDRYQFEAEAMKISVTSLSTISGIRRPSTSVSSCVES